MRRGNLSLLLQRKRKKERKRRPWHESIRSWWKGIPKICEDEIILNPKSLQISRLILTYSSQVIAAGGVGGVFAFHLGSGLSAWRSRMNHPSDSSMWIFCSVASKQKLWRGSSAENWYLIKARTRRSQTSRPFFFQSFSSSFFIFFLSKQLCLFMLLSFQPSHWYPRSQMCSKTQTHATSRAGFWV